MALITVYTAQDEFMALSIRDLLADDGIPCILQSNALPGFGGMTWLEREWGAVQVEEEQAERALELVSGFLGNLGELAEAEIIDE